MKSILAASAVLAVITTLVGCASNTGRIPISTAAQDVSISTASSNVSSTPGVPTGDDVLSAHGLSGLDAARVIERLDTMPVADRPSGLLASVRPDGLVISDDEERETRLPMPEDEVYISVAPYLDQTHECHFHSLTTCLGELRNTEVHVTLTADDGRILLDTTRRTYDNGFVGLWVPRGTAATLVMQLDGRSGSASVSTMRNDDATCVTTLQLT